VVHLNCHSLIRLQAAHNPGHAVGAVALAAAYQISATTPARQQDSCNNASPSSTLADMCMDGYAPAARHDMATVNVGIIPLYRAVAHDEC
jgi:hypothetical protein